MERLINVNDKVWEVYKEFVIKRYKGYLEGKDPCDCYSMIELSEYALNDAITVVETYFNEDSIMELTSDVIDPDEPPTEIHINGRDDHYIHTTKNILFQKET